MTKPKKKPELAVEAVREALARERGKRQGELKPVEIVKVAICAFQAHAYSNDAPEAAVESPDRKGLRRGTQASVDRLLFNANYWLAAYEERIVAASPQQEARSLLEAVTVWGSHTLKLNTLSTEEARATFERFCPPFATNRRRGSSSGKAVGKGPVVAFRERACACAGALEQADEESARALRAIVAEMEEEATAYRLLHAASALDAFYSLLPVWCLRDEIPLVSGSWWEDADVMRLVADELETSFLELGFGEAPCSYFRDSILEAIDAYGRDVSSAASVLRDLPVGQLICLIRDTREARPDFETEGYGRALPAWLIAKEQLIWNVVVCSLYGPGNARPLLAASPALHAQGQRMGERARFDVITELARTSFARYSADRAQSGVQRDYRSFSDQPADLRNSSIEHVKSIPGKLAVLGYEIVPEGSCYPEQRVDALTPSEVECLAILEHRRWLHERTSAGWVRGDERDAETKTSPYLVAWEDLPDRAREWNRSAIRSIPALLASEDLAIARVGNNHPVL